METRFNKIRSFIIYYILSLSRETRGGIVSRRAPLKSQSAPDESSSRSNAAGKYLSLMDGFLVNTTHARTHAHQTGEMTGNTLLWMGDDYDDDAAF